MRSVGMSVPEAVREIVTKNRSVYDCMKMDLINYTALAVKIQPEIETMLGGSINLNTIVVAIKRYADSFESKEEIDDEPVLKNARLTLNDGIMDITLPLDFGTDPTYLMNKFSQINSEYEFFRLSNNFRLTGGRRPRPAGRAACRKCNAKRPSTRPRRGRHPDARRSQRRRRSPPRAARRRVGAVASRPARAGPPEPKRCPKAASGCCVRLGSRGYLSVVRRSAEGLGLCD